jgi:hypothetical protein
LLPIKSRYGNLVLLAAGLVIALSSAGLLAFALWLSWGAVDRIERAIQLFLLLSAASGWVLAYAAAANLRLPLFRRSLPERAGNSRTAITADSEGSRTSTREIRS